MTTSSGTSQNVFIGYNSSTTYISSRFGPIGLDETPKSHSSQLYYRKSYVLWDRLERANKPDNCTEKTRYLGKNAKALLSVVYQKLRKQTTLLLNHKYISTITNSGSRQNQRIIQEIRNIVDISYKRGVTESNGKKYKNSYEFRLKNNTPSKIIQETKMSGKNAPSTIYIENKIINNRSRATCLFREKKFYPSSHNKKESQGNEGLKNKIISAVKISGSPNLSLGSGNKNRNGFLGSGKYLLELIDHITDELCDLVRIRCGRNYTNCAIREIAESVSRSKKGAKAFFYHTNGLLEYLAKVIAFEKRNPEKTGNVECHVSDSQIGEQKEIYQQEKYLTGLESSLQVGPEWHLKKRLAAVLERSKAYNFLKSYKSLDICGKRAKVVLRNFVELSKSDRDIILREIQATHEKIGGERECGKIESFEIKTFSEKAIKSRAVNQQIGQNFSESEEVWNKIRESFASCFGKTGSAVDEYWLSKFSAKINKERKMIELKATNSFVKDWVERNYLQFLEDAAKNHGFRIKLSIKLD